MTNVEAIKAKLLAIYEVDEWGHTIAIEAVAVLDALVAENERLRGALALAANRLDRITVDAIASGDERKKCELREWADAARAALKDAARD